MIRPLQELEAAVEAAVDEAVEFHNAKQIQAMTHMAEQHGHVFATLKKNMERLAIDMAKEEPNVNNKCIQYVLNKYYKATQDGMDEDEVAKVVLKAVEQVLGK